MNVDDVGQNLENQDISIGNIGKKFSGYALWHVGDVDMFVLNR